MVYAPTLLPIPDGNTKIEFLIDFSKRECSLSLIIPVFLSTVPKKLIGSLDFKTIPSTFPDTKILFIVFHLQQFVVMILNLFPHHLNFLDKMHL